MKQIKSLFVIVLAIVAMLLLASSSSAFLDYEDNSINNTAIGGQGGKGGDASAIGIGIGIGGKGGIANVNNDVNIKNTNRINNNIGVTGINKNTNKITNRNLQGQNQGQSQKVVNSANTNQTAGDVNITYQTTNERELPHASEPAPIARAVDPVQTYRGMIGHNMLDPVLTWSEAKNMKGFLVKDKIRAYSRKELKDIDHALTAKFVLSSPSIRGKRLAVGWALAPDIGAAQAEVAYKAMKVGHKDRGAVTVHFVLETVPVGKVRGFGGFITPQVSKVYKTSGIAASGGGAFSFTNSRNDLYYKISYVVTEEWVNHYQD